MKAKSYKEMIRNNKSSLTETSIKMMMKKFETIVIINMILRNIFLFNKII